MARQIIERHLVADFSYSVESSSALIKGARLRHTKFKCPSCGVTQANEPGHGVPDCCDMHCGLHWIAYGNALYLSNAPVSPSDVRL